MSEQQRKIMVYYIARDVLRQLLEKKAAERDLPFRLCNYST